MSNGHRHCIAFATLLALPTVVSAEPCEPGAYGGRDGDFVVFAMPAAAADPIDTATRDAVTDDCTRPYGRAEWLR